VLDGQDPTLWERELDTISHRPYSTGFFFGDAQQSTDADMYQQLYDWVGEVVRVLPNEDGTWRVWAKCRNRFYQGDELEVLSPHEPIRFLEVTDLFEVFGYDLENQGFEELDSYAEVPTDTARKAMGLYVFTSSIALKPRDILRVKRKDPNRKN